MGRQLQLASTEEDEIELIEFISTLSSVRVFQGFANTLDDLWLKDLASITVLDSHLYLWPEAYPWTPEYKQTGGPRCPKDRRGLFYVANKNAAPLFELSRSNLRQRRFGRIYWASDFSAPEGLHYDKHAFASLVDRVWRQIRKIGEMDEQGPIKRYWLPHAMSWRRGNSQK